MQVTDSELRFPALHKAIAKMNAASRPPYSPRCFDDEEECAPAEAACRVVPEGRVRPAVTSGAPMEWVLAEAVSSAERRVQRLARLRAQRELADQRAQMVQTISRLRRAKAESQIRQSETAVREMEQRLRDGGHTGRLGWMEAQVSPNARGDDAAELKWATDTDL